MDASKRDAVQELVGIARQSNTPPSERTTALAEAEELRRSMRVSWSKLGIDPKLVKAVHTELVAASAVLGVHDAVSEAPRSSPRSADDRKSLGIGTLARSLIVEHPEWTYARIANEVNATIAGAKASEKSVRWYSHQMRKTGVAGTRRSRVPAT